MLQVHLESKRVAVRHASLPRTPTGFARIRMLAAGICSTDLELQRGYYGFSGTPGHEFAGEVVAVNGCHEEQANWLGQRVAGEINLACAHCDWCSRGLGRHCPRRTVLGIVMHAWSFAEILILHIINSHRITHGLESRI